MFDWLPVTTGFAFHPDSPERKPYSLPPEVIARENELNRLGDEIATLSAQIQAATYELLVLIKKLDDIGHWDSACRSCAHWLNWRTGLNLGAAREKVRVARALAHLPRISEAMRCGEMSYSKVRAMTRVATPENEERLLQFARCGTAGHVERLVQIWRMVDRNAEQERDERRMSRRYFKMFTDQDGMLVVSARLDPETGAIFKRALTAAADRIRDTASPMPDPDSWVARTPVEDPTASLVNADDERRRYVDAMGLMAESALAADLDPGARSDRYQVVLHVDESALLSDPPPVDPSAEPLTAALDDAIGVSAETSRRFACDAAVTRVTQASDGSVLNVGRRTRTISPALRRALVARDRGCRFPGCCRRACEAHHIKHWADGGETNLDNLILLCRRHHRVVHEEGYRVELGPGSETRFFHRMGFEIPRVPKPPPCGPAPVAEIEGRLKSAGVTPGPQTSLPNWYGEGCDWHIALANIRHL